jgi:hypothetical protein
LKTVNAEKEYMNNSKESLNTVIHSKLLPSRRRVVQSTKYIWMKLLRSVILNLQLVGKRLTQITMQQWPSVR